MAAAPRAALAADSAADREPPLAEIADQLRAATGAPGVLLALKHDGRMYLSAVGEADAQQNLQLEAGGSFPVGSITKMFTTVIVLQLAQEGRLSLDDPLSRFMPDYPHGDAITLRMLLNHTSGLWDYTDARVPLMLVPFIAMKQYTPQEIADFVSRQPLYFAPGADFHYSNSNYILLGMIIEQLSGATYGSELHRRILTPLKLEHTYLAGFDELPAEPLRGYMLVDGELKDRTAWENPSLAWAAGAIVSNAADLSRFAEALFGGELLSAASLTEMQQPVAIGNGGFYGLGLTMFELPGGRACGHSGETLGFTSDLFYQPATGDTLVLLVNLAFCRTTPAVEAVLQWLHNGQLPEARNLPERLNGRERGLPGWAVGAG